MTTAGQLALAEAKRWIGTPYLHQASNPGVGADCLGLLRGVWRSLYGHEVVAVPPYAADARSRDDALEEAATSLLLRRSGPLEAGDVLLFRLLRHRPPQHCAIYAGNNRMIHAQERLGVLEVEMTTNWRRRLASSFAFPETQASSWQR